jgi:anti-anti-sigma factor
MEITTQQNADAITLSIDGYIDSSTATELESRMHIACNATKNLTINFAKVDFISSAGLRVLLIAQKALAAKNGRMVIINVNDNVRELFDLTGFSDILTIG